MNQMCNGLSQLRHKKMYLKHWTIYEKNTHGWLYQNGYSKLKNYLSQNGIYSTSKKSRLVGMMWKWTILIIMMNNSKINIEGFGIQDKTVNQNNQYKDTMKKEKVTTKISEKIEFLSMSTLNVQGLNLSLKRQLIFEYM